MSGITIYTTGACIMGLFIILRPALRKLFITINSDYEFKITSSLDEDMAIINKLPKDKNKTSQKLLASILASKLLLAYSYGIFTAFIARTPLCYLLD